MSKMETAWLIGTAVLGVVAWFLVAVQIAKETGRRYLPAAVFFSPLTVAAVVWLVDHWSKP